MMGYLVTFRGRKSNDAFCTSKSLKVWDGKWASRVPSPPSTREDARQATIGFAIQGGGGDGDDTTVASDTTPQGITDNSVPLLSLILLAVTMRKMMIELMLVVVW